MDCSKVPLCKRPLTMAGYASACHGPQGSEEFFTMLSLKIPQILVDRKLEFDIEVTFKGAR